MENIHTPSGVVYTPEMQQLVRLMVRHGTITWKEEAQQLYSGRQSRVYVNGRAEVTCNPRCARMLLRPLVDYLLSSTEGGKLPICIGVPLTGTGLAGCLSGSYTRNGLERDIGHQLMRESPKTHGGDKGWVTGAYNPDTCHYFTVENTVTSGDSLLKSLSRMEEDDFDTKSMTHLVLVDRGLGGVENVRVQGYDVRAFYTLRDVLYVMSKLELWPSTHIGAALEEIAG